MQESIDYDVIRKNEIRRCIASRIFQTKQRTELSVLLQLNENLASNYSATYSRYLRKTLVLFRCAVLGGDNAEARLRLLGVRVWSRY